MLYSRSYPSLMGPYATCPEESAYPELWAGLVGLYVPSMGRTANALVDFSLTKGRGIPLIGGVMNTIHWRNGGRRGWTVYNDNTLGNGAIDLGQSATTSPLSLSGANRSWTLMAWARHTVEAAFGNRATIISRTVGSGGGAAWDYYLGVLNTGATRVEMFGPSNPVITGGTTIVLNRWYHYAAVRDHHAGTITLYLDGVVDGSVANDPADFATANSPALLRAGPTGTERWSGEADEFYFYNRALRAHEIRAVYFGASPLVVGELFQGDRPGSITATVAFTLAAATVAARVNYCAVEREDRARFLLGRGLHRSLYSSAMMTSNLTRGQRDVAVQALAFQQRATQRLTVGTDSYALPSDYVASWALHVDLYTAGLRLYDTNNVAWYLVVSTAGDLSFTASVPPTILGTGTPTSLRLTDQLGGLWYVSPSLAGAILIAAVPPAGTVLTSAVQLRDAFGVPWYPSITSAPVLSAAATGTATVSAAALAPRALVYVDRRAFQHLDPRLTSAYPVYYTVFPPQQLKVYPSPTAIYDLVHYYFGDGLTNCDVPPQVEQEIVWHAVHMAMLRRGQVSGSRAAQQMEQRGLERLGPRYLPGHDALEDYRMPTVGRFPMGEEF